MKQPQTSQSELSSVREAEGKKNVYRKVTSNQNVVIVKSRSGIRNALTV